VGVTPELLGNTSSARLKTQLAQNANENLLCVSRFVAGADTLWAQNLHTKQESFDLPVGRIVVAVNFSASAGE